MPDSGVETATPAVVQSSSPSYLLMTSLDAARAAAAALGAFDEALAAAAAAREAAGQMARLQVLSSSGGATDCGRPTLDPLKLTLGVVGLGISGGHHCAAQHAGWCRQCMWDRDLSCLQELVPCSCLLSSMFTGIAGYQAADWLAEQGIATELATSRLVLAAFGAGSTMQDACSLIAALKGLCQRFGSTLQPAETLPSTDAAVQAPDNLPVPAMLPRAVLFATTERQAHTLRNLLHNLVCACVHLAAHSRRTAGTMRLFEANDRSDAIVAPCRVPWDQAAGRVCAELLCPYPPGIPAVVPGEVLTPAVLADLRHVLQAGGMVTGAADADLQSVAVVCAETVAEERIRE